MPKLRLRKFLPCLIFFSWACSAVFSQVNNSAVTWSVRAWQTDEGLPDNDVTGIAQNSDGYLWLATQGGLALFDGVRFRDVDLPTPSERTRPLIRASLLENNGTFWAALEGGAVVNLRGNKIIFFGQTNGLPNFRPTSIAQAADGSIWIGFVDGSACQIVKNQVTRFTAKSGLAGNGPCIVAADAQGKIWFAKAGQLMGFRDGKFFIVADLPEGSVRLAAARNRGLWIFVGKDLLKIEGDGPLQKILSLNAVAAGVSASVVFEDHAGAVWLGTFAGGLFCATGTNVFSVPTSYPDVLSLAEDREQNIWVGTGGGGLNRLRPRVLELQGTDAGLPFASVRSVCADNHGALWAATQNGSLARLENGVWKNLSAETKWATSRATCVAADNAGGVWIGTTHDGLQHWHDGQMETFTRDDGLGGETVRALLADKNGDLWIATESPSAVQKLHAKNFQNFSRPTPSRTVRAMAQDSDGKIWLGTLDGYLLRVDGDKLVDVTAGTLAKPKPIRCLYAAPDGDLWIGYAGAGAGRIRAGKFSAISTDRGLHDAYICAMTLDDGGGFWFSSDHGIFQVRQNELEDALTGKISGVRSVLFGREESLPSLQGNFGYTPNFARTDAGRIVFPTRSGLVFVNPNQSQPNHLAPPVAIERVLVDGAESPLKNGGAVKIPPRHRRIDIEFTALSFVAPENVNFRYKLDGWDDNWNTPVRGQRAVNYTRLPAGDYTFRVSACNNAGIWNERGAALNFTVEPFVWQTWWFRATIISGLLLAVAVAVRFYSHRNYRLRLQKLEQENALQKERARIAKDIHDELGANLTQISLLGKFTEHDLAEPEKARTHVEKIAAIARAGVRSVDEIVWAVNPRNDTLAQLLDYAGQFAVDFSRAAEMRCRIDFPEKVPLHNLPADTRHDLFLIVKEALHNAVKHSGAQEIILRAEIFGGELRLEIADNGRGFASPKDDALADGLRNMKQRAVELGGECVVESAPAHGTKVRVRLKLP